MKLQAGNPNLMQKMAMRVNKTATLKSFVPSTGDKNPSRYVRGGYVPMERDPNATPAAALNIWERPVYVVEKPAYVRPGANDHQLYKSKG